MATLLCLPICNAITQAAASPQSDSITIQGRVLDSAGHPVSGASVSLEQSSGSVKTTPNSGGRFFFAWLRSGTYALIAEKSGLRSPISSISITSGREPLLIALILEASAAGRSDSGGSQPPRPEAMTFADKPDFTVAGIIDSTAGGGHGSDMNLRTSEALARETAALNPDR